MRIVEFSKKKLIWLGLAALGPAATYAGPIDVELDVEVGQSGGALAFEPFDFGVVALEAYANSPIPFLPDAGWVGDDPGWATHEHKKLGGLEPLADGANIVVEFLSLSPALRAFDAAGGQEIMVGGTYVMGGPEFDAHPIWVIDSTSPLFDPNQSEWTATMRLVDTGTTNYGSTGSFDFRFTTPEPSSLALLALAASFGLIRRR